MKIIHKILLVTIILSSFAFNLEAAEDKNLYEKAIGYIENGQNEFAFLKFQRIIELFPRSKYAEEAQVEIIEYFLSVGFYGKSEKEIEKYYEKYPQGKNKEKVREYYEEVELKGLLERAKDLFTEKEWSESLTAYKSALKYNPNNPFILRKIDECEEKKLEKLTFEEEQSESEKDKDVAALEIKQELIKGVALKLGISEDELLENYANFWKID